MPTVPVLLGVLVAISGAASLICELVWIRALGLHFGTTTPAITTVVATFMAGLGLGNLWFGRRADRSARPFVLYRWLELGIGISGLGVSLLLLHAGTWLDGLARLCARAGSLSTAAMVCVFAALMLVPTTAMGGTLPVLTRALSLRAEPGRALGLLYATNTLGAIVGALAPDFLLIPQYGMTFTACVAAAGNLTVALLVPYCVSSNAESPATEAPLDAHESQSSMQLAALAITACSGFCALGLEVLWSRTLQHWAAALVTSFAVLLAVYLTALACGVRLAQRYADRSRHPLRAAALLLGLTALAALVPIAVSPAWRDLERAWWPRPSTLRRVGLLREAFDALLHAGYLEAVSCTLMGATFPFVAAAWLRGGKPGARAGQLFLINTLGGVLGALMVGFVWLPNLGEQASYCVLALLLASVAAGCAVVSRERWSGVSTVACLASVVSLTLWLPNQQLFRAHFRTGGQLVAVQEGATTTAAAAERFVYGEPYYMELLTPGVSMSSTSADARRYMAVMAHAGLLTAHRTQRALLVCYGVGNTASALLSHRDLKRLDVVDISPEVLALAPHFAAARGDNPLADPRTHVFVDDGRHHLITHDALYDVITAEPPPPNYAGVVNLYSREFYRLAKSRLAAGGVITQWLPVFQLADSDVRSMVAAFVAELPHTALLYGYEQQLVLIGSLQPLAVEGHTLQTLASDVTFARNLRTSCVGNVDDLLGSVLQTDAELRREVAGVLPLSDERPTIQYPYEAVSGGALYTQRFVPDPLRALSLLDDELQRDPPLAQRVLRAWNATEEAISALSILERTPSEARELALGRILSPALDARPDNEGLWSLLSADIDRVRLAETALARPGAQSLLAHAQYDAPRYWVLHDAMWLLARRAFYARDYARALTLLDRIRPSTDEAPSHALFRAGCLRALGQIDASSGAFRAAAAVSGNKDFRTACQALAEHAAEPFTRRAGPWSLAH